MESNFIKSININKYQKSDEDYHAEKDYISASAMKKLKVSPAHFKEEEVEPETDALIFGSAYHSFILEPDKFENEYYIFDDHVICEQLIGDGYKSPRQTKAYKEWETSEMRVIGNKKVITKNIFDTIRSMKEKLMHHPYAKMLLLNGENEQGYSGEIITDVGPINVKFKPDKVNEKKKLIIDLKTTFDASADGFTKHAADLNYHIQASFYSDLMELISGDNMAYTFIFIAQEKKKPYAFNLFECSPQFIAQGRYEYELLLMLYKYCLDNNYWPGYQVWCQNKYGLLELKLPAWSIKEINYYDHLHKKTN